MLGAPCKHEAPDMRDPMGSCRGHEQFVFTYYETTLFLGEIMDLRMLVGGTAFFTLGFAVCVGSYKLGLGRLDNPGPGFILFIAGSTMALLSVVDIITAFLPSKREVRTLASLWRGLYWRRAAFIIFITLLYVLLLNLAGFLIITPFYVGSCMRVVGYQKWLIMGITIVVSTLLFYLLAYFFALPIPLLPGLRF